APSRPACHVPSVLVTCPLASSSAVDSPKYQTLPALSCEYQSVVRSRRCPAMYRRSSTTTHGAPSIGFVLYVTVTTSRDGRPSLMPRYTSRVPGFNGNHGLSTRALKPGSPARAAPATTATTSAATPMREARGRMSAVTVRVGDERSMTDDERPVI